MGFQLARQREVRGLADPIATLVGNLDASGDLLFETDRSPCQRLRSRASVGVRRRVGHRSDVWLASGGKARQDIDELREARNCLEDGVVSQPRIHNERILLGLQDELSGSRVEQREVLIDRIFEHKNYDSGPDGRCRSIGCAATKEVAPDVKSRDGIRNKEVGLTGESPILAKPMGRSYPEQGLWRPIEKAELRDLDNVAATMGITRLQDQESAFTDRKYGFAGWPGRRAVALESIAD